MTNLADSWPPRHRLTVEEFHRMGETGILRPAARVELVQGEIIDMAPIGGRHAWAVAKLTRQLILEVGERAFVWTQNPIVLDDHTELQPDIALLAPKAERDGPANPHPRDILLVVEVSDSTLRYDRDVKLPLYARHRIPEAWIVDLEHRALIVCRNPADEAYGDIRTLTAAGVVAPRELPGCHVDFGGIF